MTRKISSLVGATIVAAMFALFLGVALPARADSTEPFPPTFRFTQTRSVTFLAPSVITAAGTTSTNTAVPIGSPDQTRVGTYVMADVFATFAVSGTGYVTITPQFSMDGSNWSNAYYRVLSGTAFVDTPVTVSRSTAGTSHWRMPLYGDFVRFNIVRTNDPASAITTTVRAKLIN